MNDFTRAKLKEQSLFKPLIPTQAELQYMIDHPPTPEELARREEEYTSALASRFRWLKLLFYTGQYDLMAEDYCHEGYSVLQCNWHEDTTPNDRLVEVGLCSHGERIRCMDLPAECQAWESPYALEQIDYVNWPPAAKEAMKRLGLHMLAELNKGYEGC